MYAADSFSEYESGQTVGKEMRRQPKRVDAAEHNTKRLPARVPMSHGEKRIVGSNSAGTYNDCINLGALAVHQHGSNRSGKDHRRTCNR